jgi:L-alanine-DL-glutamate epimerase-like enolase superfamily enzyme
VGGENRPVLAYATGGYYRDDGHPDGMAEEAASFVAKGYRAVKIKDGGGTLAEDVERVRLAREAIGRDTLLLLDCTAAFPGASFGVESNGVPDPLWSGMYRHRAQIRDGYIHLDEAPGFGIEIDWDFIRRHAA